MSCRGRAARPARDEARQSDYLRVTYPNGSGPAQPWQSSARRPPCAGQSGGGQRRAGQRRAWQRRAGQRRAGQRRAGQRRAGGPPRRVRRRPRLPGEDRRALQARGAGRGAGRREAHWPQRGRRPVRGFDGAGPDPRL
ncbi:MAG: hypothetical protein FJ137_09810 [Deltaproteobacteria bacterium]|nr:hypothetical protein [Deltaproteobacteria bacterium]